MITNATAQRSMRDNSFTVIDYISISTGKLDSVCTFNSLVYVPVEAEAEVVCVDDGVPAQDHGAATHEPAARKPNCDQVVARL